MIFCCIAKYTCIRELYHDSCVQEFDVYGKFVESLLDTTTLFRIPEHCMECKKCFFTLQQLHDCMTSCETASD